jgi:hypothetical protein
MCRFVTGRKFVIFLQKAKAKSHVIIGLNEPEVDKAYSITEHVQIFCV